MISIDSLSAVRRAGQVYYEQVAERQTLSCGIAFYSQRYAGLSAANQVREVVLAGGRTMEQAYPEVEAFYASQGLTCGRWAPASTQQSEPVGAFLTARGWEAVTSRTMLWRGEADEGTKGPATAPAAVKGLRILPARAMRQAYQRFLEADEGVPAAQRALHVALKLDRLDDPQLDLFVAVLEGEPVGVGGLFQVGDIARVEDFGIVPAFRGRGVGSALLSHIVALAHRLAIRVTCLETADSDALSQQFFASRGFAPGAAYVEFHRRA